MTAQPWPDHLLTLEEYDALPEDNSRHYELEEGILILSPRAASLHHMVASHLMLLLYPQLPPEWCVLHDAEVVIQRGFPTSVRAPDVLIVPKAVARANVPRFTPDQVLLAVEIISPGSRVRDSVTKAAEYARAGIPHYWVIDLDEQVSLTEHRLVGDLRYQQFTAVTGVFKTAEPFSLEIDLTQLPDCPSSRGGLSDDRA
jgi:Uma2 family endonuclease